MTRKNKENQQLKKIIQDEYQKLKKENSSLKNNLFTQQLSMDNEGR